MGEQMYGVVRSHDLVRGFGYIRTTLPGGASVDYPFGSYSFERAQEGRWPVPGEVVRFELDGSNREAVCIRRYGSGDLVHCPDTRVVFEWEDRELTPVPLSTEVWGGYEFKLFSEGVQVVVLGKGGIPFEFLYTGLNDWRNVYEKARPVDPRWFDRADGSGDWPRVLCVPYGFRIRVRIPGEDGLGVFNKPTWRVGSFRKLAPPREMWFINSLTSSC